MWGERVNNIIPFTEIKVPADWNYNNSVKKMQPLVRKWTDMSYKFFLELKVARKALAKDGNPNLAKMPRPGWNQYCQDIGISQRHANRLLGEYFEDPFIYNIWNMPKGDKEEYFGHFPIRFMRNLLYYHTQENDLIYDPFVGSGTTIDVCEEMGRSYYCSDLFPQRENIKQWDIADGLPDEIEKIDLAFLDPPYWKQAEGKYSNDSNDLSNMDLDDFNNSMMILLTELSIRNANKITIVIQPTQYKNDFVWQDHIFDFAKMLSNYQIEMRYILPYSTQQYNAQQVEKAKIKKKALGLNRDLVIWRKINS